MIVCADDFGLTDDINRAVLDLVKHGRVSAVSCMVALEHFDTHAFSRLLRNGDRIDIGLHLTLTDIRPVHPLSEAGSLVRTSGLFCPFGRLFRRSLRRGVRSAAVTRETAAQFDRFCELAGRRPDFIDSHLHVHQLPRIRKGVVQFMEGLESAPYIRNTAMSAGKISRQGVSTLKCHAIGRFGRVFRDAAEGKRFQTNEGFAGVYDYRRYRSFPLYLRRFVEHMENENGILMTHPGETEAWRRMEYRTLLETDCLQGRINRFQKPAG